MNKRSQRGCADDILIASVALLIILAILAQMPWWRENFPRFVKGGFLEIFFNNAPFFFGMILGVGLWHAVVCLWYWTRKQTLKEECMKELESNLEKLKKEIKSFFYTTGLSLR
jgi:hypothetical protein